MEKRAAAAIPSLGLDGDDCSRLAALYNERLAEHGVSVKTVGWGSREDQSLRFEVLCRGLDLKGKRVLDLGCGLGDFVQWAEGIYGGDFDYVGVDLAQDLVTAANERFGGARRQFLVGTLSPDQGLDDFDIVISSGALSFRTSDNFATMQALLSQAWTHTREALSVNFLSSYVDFQLEKNFHFQPEAVFTFARSLSRWVTVHHDYPLYEFTVQVFRQSRPSRLIAP